MRIQKTVAVLIVGSLHGEVVLIAGASIARAARKERWRFVTNAQSTGAKPGETPEIFLTPEEKGLQNQKVALNAS